MSGTYDFLFREYNANQGRWISPNPAGLGAVDRSNPQTWNRYAYVMNNPLSFVDPLGLTDCPQGKTCPIPVPPQPPINVVAPPPIDRGAPGGPVPVIIVVPPGRECFGCGLFIGYVPAPSEPNSQKPGTPPPSKVPCTNVPKSPPGVSATANLNLVNRSTQGMWPATKLAYFDMVFRTGGAFDYKSTYGGAGWGNPDQFVDYGNWNFGFVCGANYSSLFCQSAAGANRMWRTAMQRKNPFGSGVPFVKAPYGDQAADDQQIRNGIQAQASGCVQ